MRATFATLLLAASLSAPATVQAQGKEQGKAPPRAGFPAAPWTGAVLEASARFALPERWLHAVIHVESGGNPQARSGKGAMGLMQLMPATWAALSMQQGLGSDPFDPRANVLAGAAFLRAMFDRYGDLPSALAAYNAGPGRVDAWRRTGHSLPAETLAYVARLSLLLGPDAPQSLPVSLPVSQPVSVPATAAPAGPKPSDWRASGLFGECLPTVPADGSAPSDTPGREVISAPARPLSPGLFVALSQRGEP
jgi:hypothetical protein